MNESERRTAVANDCPIPAEAGERTMSQNDLGCSWSRNSDYASPEGRTKQMNGVTEDKGSEAANQLDHLFGTPGGITSALKSVAFHMWGHEGCDSPQSQPCLVPDQNKGSLDSKAKHQWSFGKQKSATLFKSNYILGCPLYQDYCKASGKGDMMNLSKLLSKQCLPGLQSPPGTSLGTTTSPPQHIKVMPCTLWQDLTEVRERRLLTSLALGEIRLQESKFEMIVSEASYLKSLGVVIDHFFASKTLRLTLSKMEHRILFSNVCLVQAASERFLRDLEVRLGEDLMISQIGDIVLRHCPAFRSLYVPYVTNMMYQEALFERLLQENREFLLAVTKLESDSVCQRQRLRSFLVLPFQRITRLKIIMESIVKFTEKDSESVPCLREAIEAIHKIVSECNEQTQRMKRIEELVHLEKLVYFRNVKSIAFIISGRYLVHEGSLRQPLLGSPWGTRVTFKDIYVHLFNDLLLISLKKGLRFHVLDYAAFPSHVCTEPLKEVTGLPSESFLLRLSRNHAGQAIALILVPHTISDQQTWMMALSPTKSTTTDP
ncbi:rho guanine nucleotide exchange factor 19 isoform X2 [Hypomesus transpacificus]|uniref:rho guanine nucleotide exchange factor 19 isoform X2 n=1 Tax=Hypomesus transpacificus TaxID=137520 RepID=UPI001F082682|nr:rho guanine nucleotide exchange factor 19 isoform X2 [Hypomesus transpacificus]